MANVFLQQGDTTVLDAVVNDAGVLATLRLFQNDHDPAPTDLDANYVEADFSGYAAVDISAEWGAAFVNPFGQGQIDCLEQVFTHSGGAVGNTVYGVYVTSNTGKVMYAERFSTPVLIETGGSFIGYTAKVTAVTA